MKFTSLTVLLPCHSLEDFPVYYDGPQADELLAAWCAPWHPALIASAASVPGWHRVDVPPENLESHLLLLAPFCTDRLPAGFVSRAKIEGGWLVRHNTVAAAVAAALEGLDGGGATVCQTLANDFLALGFCRLQIELLTRQMRYSMHVDETHFQNETVAAAQAAMAGNESEAREHLAASFETLYEARKHFYPVDAYLLDITLLAETTLGNDLTAELARATPTNLMIRASLLEKLAQDAPGQWSQLLEAIDRGRACVLGSDLDERELPLLPLESIRGEIAAGVREYESRLGRGPRVYARRRFGLTPVLPQILTRLGFQGALHFTLDDGRFPLASQSKTRWEGLDSSAIDIFAGVPNDASKPESLLGFSRKMADAMDNDHVATLAFAHWPDQCSPWYDLLRRVVELSPALGKFTLLDDYFSNTDMPGRISKFEPDEYRLPYLKQAVIRRQDDPISTFTRAHRQQAERAAARAIRVMHSMVRGLAEPDSHGCCTKRDSGQNLTTIESLDRGVSQLAAALPQGGANGVERRVLVANPLSFARRIGVELPSDASTPVLQAPVVAAARTATRNLAIVDVPAMGFAWCSLGRTEAAPARAKLIGDEKTKSLANEFLQVQVSGKTGGIQSVYNFQQRGNQLSQQIAMRAAEAGREQDADTSYSEMRAESVEITENSSVFAEIISQGTLVAADGRRLATFRQSVQVWAGNRVIRVGIDLSDVEAPRADPWNSYYGVRFAWPGETAEIHRGVSLTRQQTTVARFEAPEYFEIDDGSGRIAILTGGLPYHRRSGNRMLDSLLIVRGETARSFSFGIGIDLPQPASSAVEFITPPTAVAVEGPAPAHSSGWLFHLDAKNVLATHWQPLVEESAEPSEADAPRAVRGFRARILETAGRAGRVTLRTFRDVASARQVDFLGQTIVSVPAENDKIRLDFAAHEWIEVEAVWKGIGGEG